LESLVQGGERERQRYGSGQINECMYSLWVAGEQADAYHTTTKVTTKPIAEYVGRVYVLTK